VRDTSFLNGTYANPELTHAHAIADYAGMMLVTTPTIRRAF
jgi:hypothetical protein